jgi:Fur family transcriptional regulator, ferric uptake regulator
LPHYGDACTYAEETGNAQRWIPWLSHCQSTARTRARIEAMPKVRHDDWIAHALGRLAEAGYRKGGARLAVVECLGKQSCAVSALQIENELRAKDAAAGRASIYRALEQLEGLGLIHRLEVGTGTASYELAEPDGEHHHHLVCANCGKVVPFEDSGLERAIGRLAGKVSFDVSGHDVVLRGRCPNCAARRKQT